MSALTRIARFAEKHLGSPIALVRSEYSRLFVGHTIGGMTRIGHVDFDLVTRAATFHTATIPHLDGECGSVRVSW